MTVTRKVYFDWDKDGSFTDMSAYVLSVTGSIGRRRWQSRVAEVGTCYIELNNEDRSFTPNNTGGTYYGQLVPNIPVRVEIVDSTGTHRLMTMWTTEFVPQAGQNRAQRCIVACFDRMGQLQESDISLPLQTDETAGTVLRKIFSGVYESGQASATAYMLAVAADDTLTVGGQTYTYKTSLTPAENEVGLGTQNFLIAAGAQDAAINAAAAINRDEGSGTHYAATTTRHADVTAQGYMGVGWAASNYDSDYLLRETANNYEALACSFSFAFNAGANYDEQNVLPMRRVYLYLKKVGSPTGTLTLRHEIPTGAGGSPSGTLYNASGTTTYNEADLSTSFQWVAFDFTEYEVGSWAIDDTSNLHWLVLSTDRGVSGTDYVVWGGDTDGSGRFSEDKKASGAWAGRVSGTHPLMYLPAILDVKADAHGAWGNSLALSQTGGNIVVSGATFSGGVDGPSGSITADTGLLTFDYAGDTWVEGETNAFSAARDVTDSEYGLLWAARDGTITFRDQNYQFEQSNTAATLTIDDQHTDQRGRVSKLDIINRVTISYEPRLALASTTIARSNKPIYITGANDAVLSAFEKRWNQASSLNPGSVGKTTLVLPFVDSGTGSRIGGLSITQPLTPVTHYTVYGTKDKTGPEVSAKGFIKFALALVASGVQVELTNTFNHWGYVHDLTIPGVGLYRQDTVQEIREDSTSRSAYGLRAYEFSLPFPADTTEIFVEALAWYLLNRFKDPQYLVESISFRGTETVGGTSIFDVEIGDVLDVTETQTDVSNYKLMVLGMDYRLPENDTHTVTFYTTRLNDTTYWLLGTTNFGELGTNTYLAL